MTLADQGQGLCPECNKYVGRGSDTDAYKHMLHCLNVQPAPFHDIRANAEREGSEHGRRVLMLMDIAENRVAVRGRPQPDLDE